jgi:hypothetical protein
MNAVPVFGRAGISVLCPFSTGEFGDESEAGVLTVVTSAQSMIRGYL